MSTFKPVTGKRIRVTKLDECGRVPPADHKNSFVVSKGLTSVSLSSETEDGEEIITKAFDGSLEINKRLADAFKRFTVEIKLTGVNPDVWTLLSNAEPFDGYGKKKGVQFKSGQIKNKFALELWTGLSGKDCAEGEEEASGYFLLPFVTVGTMGDMEVNGDDAIDFTIENAFTEDGNSWEKGPYKVMMNDDDEKDILPESLDSLLHLLIIDTGVAPPPTKSGGQSFDDASKGLVDMDQVDDLSENYTDPDDDSDSESEGE